MRIHRFPIKMHHIGEKSPLVNRVGVVSARTLKAWGKRLRIPRDVYQLNKVAKALGCHIEDLIEPEVAEAASESKGDGPD